LKLLERTPGRLTSEKTVAKMSRSLTLGKLLGFYYSLYLRDKLIGLAHYTLGLRAALFANPHLPIDGFQ
jgi:hypothetical protein